VPFSTRSAWSLRYPRSWITDPTRAFRIRAAVSLIITSLARDDTARRPATMIVRTCGGRSINANVRTWLITEAARPPPVTGTASIPAPRPL
jgi:hypothetical protein